MRFLWLLVKLCLYFQQFGHDVSGHGLLCLYPVWSSWSPSSQFVSLCVLPDLKHIQPLFIPTFFSASYFSALILKLR